MKFLLATAVAAASLNLALGSSHHRELRALSVCQRQLRALQCKAFLPPPSTVFSNANETNTTTTATTTAAASGTSRRLSACRARLLACSAASMPMPVPSAPATAAAAVTTAPAAPAVAGADAAKQCCSTNSGKTILDLATSTTDLSSLVATVNASGAPNAILGVLGGAGPITVFAPDNDAFTAAQSVSSTLTPDELTQLLQYHVVPGTAYCASDIPDGTTTVKTALEGCTIEIVKTGSSVMLNGDTAVTMADICGTNGVAHVINKVLIPDTANQAACTFKKSSGGGGGGGGGGGDTTTPKMVGGCAGTRYGCCSDGTKAAVSLTDPCKGGSIMSTTTAAAATTTAKPAESTTASA